MYQFSVNSKQLVYRGLSGFLLVAAFVFNNTVFASEQRIPVSAFAKLPDVGLVTISPDGNKLISKVRYDKGGIKGVVLFLLDLETDEKSVLLSTDNSKFVLGWIRWAGNDAILVSTFYPSRFYNTPVTASRLLRVDLVTKQTTSAIPIGILRREKYVPIIQDRVVDHLPENPDEILLALRTRNSVGTELYRINHKKAKFKRVHRFRANTMSWMTDRQHNVRLANSFKDTTSTYHHRVEKGHDWQELFEHKSFDEHYKRPIGFDFDPNILYFFALHEGRDAVFKADVSKLPLAPELVLADDNYDVGGRLLYSHKNQRVIGLTHSKGQGFVFWDPEYQQLQKAINKALPKTNNKIVSFSRDERKMIVFSSSDIEAGVYFLWDRDKASMKAVAYSYSELEPSLMSEKRKISYSARDGLRIEGYLTRPKGFDDQLVPAVIFPHGGPISSNGKGFDYWTQYFASKGYAVLQMNFRGSSGYGHDFMVSGLKDWGGKMQTDVEDGTRWLIEQKIVDSQKICIVGASYGGYAALMEAANNPDLYQCAASFAGVTDLPMLLNRSRKYINYNVVKEQIGSNRKKLKQTSPVNRSSEIQFPILLVHGTKDLRVPIEQGRKMHKRLVKSNKDVEYIELADGTHYLSNEEHRVTFFEALDRFLNQHLN